MSILITGGSGYIGSHTVVQLIELGHKVVIYDNLENSYPEVISRIQKITNKKPESVTGDIRDFHLLKDTMSRYGCYAVIHFAGLKSVGESNQQPIKYYDYNVTGTLNLLAAMQETGVKKFIFSSSATVYGTPQHLPIKEDHPVSTINPYGRSKLMVEQILSDLYNSDPEWMISILRYFNPVGAHKSGLIGEDPRGHPNNLMPLIAQVAAGNRPHLNIFGDDYPTPDGTGIRDYIHVEDLAAGHICALNQLQQPQCEAINLGTGNGFSVMEVIKTFERISNRKITHHVTSRRQGDVAENYADPRLASKLLNWKATNDLENMCKDTWNWISKNPNGFN